MTVRVSALSARFRSRFLMAQKWHCMRGGSCALIRPLGARSEADNNASPRFCGLQIMRQWGRPLALGALSGIGRTVVAGCTLSVSSPA